LIAFKNTQTVCVDLYSIEAVQYEEKGEQQECTEQAREYYEKAGEMYSKAHEMDDSDVDSLYNW
jgi:hypothetical protein